MRFQLSTEFIQRLVTSLALGAGYWIVLCYCPLICFSLVLVLIVVLIIVFEWTQLFSVFQPPFWALMPVYLIVPFGLLISLNHSPVYHELLFILFIVVFSFDTGSYLVGSVVGKTPICRSISPKKTWEGLIGGYCFAFAGFVLIVFEQGYKAPFLFMGFVTFMTCTLALIGDLFESYLKRRAGIKDSGALLPGHGGFLDRFDGIIFAVFFFYLFKDILVSMLIS
jgi:phosphatidate cytidylyltransferase